MSERKIKEEEMKKGLIFLVLFIAMAFSVAPVFAGGSAEASASTSEPANEITIFARTGPDSSDWLRYVAEIFTERTGIKVNFIEQGQNGYFTNLTNQLVGGTDSFDLAVTNSTYVGPWAYAGYIAPLDDYMAGFSEDFDWDDLAFSYEIDGSTYAIPYSISAFVLFYRSDLISQEELPKTWSEYIELCKKFTQSINPDSPTRYGTCWPAMAGAEQPKAFYNILWSLGGDIIVDGKAAVASEEGLTAAKYVQEMVDLGVVPPEIANYSYPECLDALLTGITAMSGPFWSAGYADIQKSDSQYKDSLKIAMLPGDEKQLAFNHSYTLVLNTNAKNPEAAMKYYEFLASKEMQLAYVLEGNGVAARFSALADENADREFYDVIGVALANTKSEPLVPYYLEQHDIMNRYLSGIMTKTMDAESAMKGAQEELQMLYDQY